MEAHGGGTWNVFWNFWLDSLSRVAWWGVHAEMMICNLQLAQDERLRKTTKESGTEMEWGLELALGWAWVRAHLGLCSLGWIHLPLPPTVLPHPFFSCPVGLQEERPDYHASVGRLLERSERPFVLKSMDDNLEACERESGNKDENNFEKDFHPMKCRLLPIWRIQLHSRFPLKFESKAPTTPYYSGFMSFHSLWSFPIQQKSFLKFKHSSSPPIQLISPEFLRYANEESAGESQELSLSASLLISLEGRERVFIPPQNQKSLFQTCVRWLRNCRQTGLRPRLKCKMLWRISKMNNYDNSPTLHQADQTISRDERD